MITTDKRYEFMIHTYGCKVNTYDTGLLQRRLETAAGTTALVKKSARASKLASGAGASSGATPGIPRVHILNTCAVTAEATREAAKQVRRLKAKEPFSKIVVTGCGAQVDGETFDTMPGVDLVVANSHKGYLERLLDEMFKGTLESRVHRSNIFRKEDLEAGGGTEHGHTRTFLKIQDGCNSFCTYCVIPFARGKSRSIPARELVSRIRELHAQGVGEVVLTGVHIGDYEDDVGGKKLALHDLLVQILEQTTVPRLRLSSLEPPELTSELLALYDNERMCPHFHMSIQSATTKTLSAMRRKYTAEEVETALTSIRAKLPHAFIGMDVIVGFPGETDDDFAETYARLERLPWTRIHVFPYSERPGTKAAAFPEVVAREERSLRSQRLRELSAQRFEASARAQVGSIKNAMLLRAAGEGRDALTRDYWPVKLEMNSLLSGDSAASLPAGQEMMVEITAYDDSMASRMDGVLTGRIVAAPTTADASPSPKPALTSTSTPETEPATILNAETWGPLVEKLGHEFKQPELLRLALTHKSRANETNTGPTMHFDNERLEFLGDAVLDLALSDCLMRWFSNDSEGALSKKRASLVNEESLSQIAMELKLDTLILLGKGEIKTGGLQKPRILASAFEAVLGAIFNDGGFTAASRAIEKLFSMRLEELKTSQVDFRSDFKTRLQELAQLLHKATPTYQIEGEQGPDHDKVFEVAVLLDGRSLTRGKGRSKKAAEQDAARLAFDLLSASTPVAAEKPAGVADGVVRLEANVSVADMN